MMHRHASILARFRDLTAASGRLPIPGGRLLPAGLGLAGLVLLAGLLVGRPHPAPDTRAPLPAPGEAVGVAAPETAALGVPVRAGRRRSLPGPLVATVTGVTDGDTLAISARIWLDQDVQVLVRLRGIDAPEKKGPCAEERAAAAEAQARLTALSGGAGATVTLTTIAPDKYNGRVIADVASASGTDLSTALLAEGLARPYQGGRRAPWCPGAEPHG